MADSPLAPHVATPAELSARHEVARRGTPFLVLRDGENRQVLVELDGSCERVTIGRREECDVALPWDGRTSRLHAEITCVAGEWVVADDGLSTNGTWVGENRVVGRRRLRDGDLVRVGGTLIAFCAPGDVAEGTSMAEDAADAVRVSPAQRRVLVALCRPVLDGRGMGAPPTNAQLADELFLSVDAIKSHMKALFDAFGLEAVPQAQKRTTLIERAVRFGVVTERDVG